MQRILVLLCAVAAIFLSMVSGRAESAQPPLKLATQVDRSMIWGDWYIVANIPNAFENKFVGLKVHFSQRKDGDVQDDFTARPHDFDHPEKTYHTRDTIIPGTDNASWRVHLLWPFIAAPFQIIYVDPADQFILFGVPDRSQGWIFSRKPMISKSGYAFAMHQFEQQGYDTSKFKRLVQFPDQLNQPEFSHPPRD